MVTAIPDEIRNGAVRVDSGSKFISRALGLWAYANKVMRDAARLAQANR